MEERGEETLEEVFGRLAENPTTYDEACRKAAEEMHRRYTWEALMKPWRGTWG